MADHEFIPAFGGGGGGGLTDAFQTISCPAGTNPVASGSDTLVFASADAKLTITGDQGTDTVTFAVIEAQINHDNLSGFVANEHIALFAGIAGTANRLTVADDGDGTITLNVDETSIDHDALLNFAAGEHFTQAAISIPSTQISDFTEAVQDVAGAFATDSSTINFTYDDVGNTLTAATIDAAIDHDALLNFAANEHFTEASIDHVNIQSIGSNTHAQIDTHIASTANPHSVTLAQAGASAFTAGSVIFSNGSTLTEDNANLFWDDSNNRLGIGIGSPGFTLHAVGTNSVFDMYSAVSAVSAFGFTFRRARGTSGAPVAVNSGDFLGRLAFNGYGATGFSSGTYGRAAIIAAAAENWTDAAQGTRLLFYTTPTSSTTPAERVRIDNAGNVGIAATSPTAKLDVRGDVDFDTGGFHYDSTNNRLGINTASPAVDLEIAGTTSQVLARISTTTGNASYQMKTDVSNFLFLGNGSTNRFAIYDNNAAANRFAIDSAGNVGIGTTSPSDKLHVAGHTYTDISNAEIYEDNSGGSTISLTTAGTYYGWVTASAGLSSGATYAAFSNNATADRILIGASGGGRYKIDFSVAFEGSASTTFTWAVYKNGTIQNNIKFARTMGTSSQTGSGSMTGFLALANTDYIDVRVTASANTKTVTVYYANLNIFRVGR